ncbi:hypothetical protein GH714_044029 [Hevea brasiliensis]|uniref:Uncharacterized protein n=1 Tax=Hevea brasiliensis TaxID=3981 RepID=A0A6A6K2I0_HEVBR|nr:hypothetical protein GH714_044029 [Hevea brasiliensis]
MFVSSSKLKEELGSIEMRLDRMKDHLINEETRVDKIEDHLITGDDRFEELESRVSGLGEGLEETRGEFQAALNETRDKLVPEIEALKIAHAEEMSTVKEDNRVLKEMVEKLQEEMVLLRRLVTRENGTSPHSTLSVPMARVVRPKPGASKGEGSAGKKDFHSRGEDRRGSRAVLKCFRCRGPHKKRDCPKRAVVLAKGKEPELPTPPLEPAGVECLPCCSLGSMRLIGPSEAPSSDGERDNGMVDAAAEEVAKTVCGTQEQSRLPRELPSKEEVDCVRERPPVSESPREVVLPGQERPRQRRSRRSRNRGKAERKAKSPSHEDGKGTEAQKKAEGNRSHGHERGPGRQGQLRGKSDRGGRSWQLTDWVCQLASLVANGLSLLDGKQANQMRKIGQPGNATGSWGMRRGSLPRWRQRVEPARSHQLEATGALPG